LDDDDDDDDDDVVVVEHQAMYLQLHNINTIIGSIVKC
jgi:hypothetical protein